MRVWRRDEINFMLFPLNTISVGFHKNGTDNITFRDYEKLITNRGGIHESLDNTSFSNLRFKINLFTKRPTAQLHPEITCTIRKDDTAKLS